jgi:bifunctional non-homologous end joining protein LigD
MWKTACEPCIPTRGTKVPAGKDWPHEIKHDSYRLIVQRETLTIAGYALDGSKFNGLYLEGRRQRPDLCGKGRWF